MKKFTFLTALVCGLIAVQTAVAQNPVATLEHDGATQVFYGQSSFASAYSASVNGDKIFLSKGYFTAPDSLKKGITVIGVGHFPDSLNVNGRTYIASGIKIGAGADSLHLEGLYINGDINYSATNSINYVKVIRCRLGSALFNSISSDASKNNCSYEECFIDGAVNFYYYGDNFLLQHCIIGGSVIIDGRSTPVGNIIGNSLIEGNIFLTPLNDNSVIKNVYSSLVKNNIFVGQHKTNGGTGNSIDNNLFVSSSIGYGTNIYSNNYTGIPQADIFVNQTGNTINYTHDYHLKSPTTYLGTDGTQVGIYGGAIPFKDQGFPSNPQIIFKSISTETDDSGNLKINFTVTAQDN